MYVSFSSVIIKHDVGKCHFHTFLSLTYISMCRKLGPRSLIYANSTPIPERLIHRELQSIHRLSGDSLSKWCVIVSHSPKRICSKKYYFLTCTSDYILATVQMLLFTPQWTDNKTKKIHPPMILSPNPSPPITVVTCDHWLLSVTSPTEVAHDYFL